MQSEVEKKNSRVIILDTAAKVFADKGYEGARVDEIAKQAGVTKSLLYYHFKSKEEIFEVLVARLYETYKGLLADVHQKELSYESSSLTQRMQTKYFPFGAENEDIVRCAFIESMKRENTCKVFFQMVELQKTGNDRKNMEKLVREYFFNIFPCVAYLCQREAWCEYFNMKEEDLGELFLKQYDIMHGSYHRGGKDD